MTTAVSLKERFQEVRSRIADAAKRSGRSPNEVLLVAVTKYAEPEQVREIIQLGQVDLAENKVQQLLQRAAVVEEWTARQRAMPGVSWTRVPQVVPSAPGLAPGTVRWHMIGHLQRNKVKKAIEFCRLIHSVDSLRLAEEIQAIAVRREDPVDVLVQVNVAGEGQKHGCAVAAAMHLVELIDTMLNVRVRGLMAMAPHADKPEQSRPHFARLRELFEEVQRSGLGGEHFNILSMGMSGDYEVAISEGANLVRVGSALFGDAGRAERDDPEDDEP